MKFKFGEKRRGGTFNFKEILPDIINEFHLEKSFTIEELRSLWHEIVGDIISTHSIPDRIYKKTLFVSVDHSAYAGELTMMKDVILKSINDNFSLCDIEAVRFEVKKLAWKRNP